MKLKKSVLTAFLVPVAMSVLPVMGQDTEHWELLDQYCADCHNIEDFSGGLAFDMLEKSDVGVDAEIWEEVLLKLQGGLMPPPGQDRPDTSATHTFTDWLAEQLDQAAANRAIEPGEIVLHRLNRSEYEHAVEDLLAIDFDSTLLLPKDDISDGFDNVANVLQVSPSFIDQYLNAARVLSNQAIGTATLEVSTANISGGSGADQNYHVDGLPLGTTGGFLAEHVFPATGEYEFSVNAFGGNADVTQRVVLLVDGELVYEKTVGGPSAVTSGGAGGFGGFGGARGFGGPGGAGAASPPDVRLPITAGTHTVGAALITSSFSESENLLYSLSGGGSGGFGGARLNGVRVTGPYNATGRVSTPSRDLIFSCYPNQVNEERACAEQIIENVAQRAFRRPVTAEDIQAPLEFYLNAREREDFEAGIQNALMAILASPNFLYRVEEAPENLDDNGVFELDGVALASRLSFFLWSSLPDQELLELATAGALTRPEILEQQVDRMLADPRAESLVTNFAFQWLDVNKLDESEPDPTLYPEFSSSLAQAFREEMRLFVGSIFQNDRPVTELMTADYTYANETLARYYGIHDVLGNRYRKIYLEDENRWGLLGKGSILLTTSYPNRTSPVLRGAWIMEKITGTPPTAPPPNVEALKETGANGEILTIRDLLQQHRANPSCNGCHGVMDPLGLALENFNATGAWVDFDRYARMGIDASGVLPDGTAISSPAELREALMRNPEQFVQTVTQKLMTFALGRTVEYHDMPRVREIVAESSEHNYTFSSLIKGIVTSMQFRMNQVSDLEDESGSDHLAAAE